MAQLFRPSWAVSNSIQVVHLDSLQVSLIFTPSSGVESVLENLTTSPLAMCVLCGDGRWLVRQEEAILTSDMRKTLSSFAEACADIWASTSASDRAELQMTGEELVGFLVHIRSFPD